MNTPTSELQADGLLPMPKTGHSYTEAEHAEFDKNERMMATNLALAKLRAPYAHILMSLRRDVDFGGFDGYGKDELHHAAADAIEQLLIALQSQIEISNTERAQAERLAQSPPQEAPAPVRADVDALAQEIRRVDGNHSLGAGALAEALMSFLSTRRVASGEVGPMDVEPEYYESLPIIEVEDETTIDELVKHMVNRFLGWRLPKPWHPDNGISYTRPNYAHFDAGHDWPTGTNLFDATQTEAMVRYMLEGASPTRAQAASAGSLWRDISRHLTCDMSLCYTVSANRGNEE